MRGGSVELVDKRIGFGALFDLVQSGYTTYQLNLSFLICKVGMTLCYYVALSSPLNQVQLSVNESSSDTAAVPSRDEC